MSYLAPLKTDELKDSANMALKKGQNLNSTHPYFLGCLVRMEQFGLEHNGHQT